MSEHKIREDAVAQALNDFNALRNAINPELQGKLDFLIEDLSEDEQAVLTRVLILAVSFGRRLERKENEKPKIILPAH